MEFGFTEEQEKLRKKVHDFFINELPEDYDSRLPFGGDEEYTSFIMDLQNKLVEKGWPTAGWPKKYGGLGYTAIEQGVVSEETANWITMLLPSQGASG